MIPFEEEQRKKSIQMGMTSENHMSDNENNAKPVMDEGGHKEEEEDDDEEDDDDHHNQPHQRQEEEQDERQGQDGETSKEEESDSRQQEKTDTNSPAARLKANENDHENNSQEKKGRGPSEEMRHLLINFVKVDKRGTHNYLMCKHCVAFYNKSGNDPSTRPTAMRQQRPTLERHLNKCPNYEKFCRDQGVNAQGYDYSLPAGSMRSSSAQGRLSDSADRPRRSALERMQELESIRKFLTPAEYRAKRQAILDSI